VRTGKNWLGRLGVGLAAVTGNLLRSRRQEAGRRGLGPHALLSPAPAVGDPELAGPLVADLVDNALR
jgi:hypothetical protein